MAVSWMSLRPLAAALVIGGLAAGLATPVAAAPVPHTDVDPATLPAGAAPAIPRVEGTTLMQQRHPRRVALGGTNPSKILHVSGGYVVETPQDGDHYRLVFISYRGKKRVLAKNSAYGGAVASSDGHWLVLSSDPYATGVTRLQHVRVVRVSNGRTIASHSFASHATVMAAGRGRVVVHETGGESTWQITGHPLKPIHTLGLDRHPFAQAGQITPPASMHAKRFVARTGDHDQLRGMADTHIKPSQQKRWWSTEPGEFVLSFSPNDKRVVTVAGLLASNEDAPWEQATTLRVRSVRTGRVLREFTGRFGYQTDEQPVWESPDSLLIHDSGSAVAVGSEGDAAYPDASLVRCAVSSGACTRVARLRPADAPVVVMRHKSN